jgi:hypothetical protein
MTFTDLQKANKTLTTTNIKGKAYTEVNQRIKAFRMLYPEGFIHTDIESEKDGVVVMRATVGIYEGEGMKVLATGHAYEKENSTQINKTSYIENCETSAVGRALGMLGIGIDTSVASAEEVGNAIAQQEALAEQASEAQLCEIKQNYPADQLRNIAEYFGHSNINQLTEAEANKVLAKARARK